MLFKSRACLQRLINKLYELCSSSSLEDILSKTKIMIFGHNKRKSNQEAFHLDKDQIEITHEYKYLGIDFYLHGHFEASCNCDKLQVWKPWWAPYEKKQ